MIIANKDNELNSKEPLLTQDNKPNLEMPEAEGFNYDIYQKANCISKLFFYWALKILKLSNRTQLKVNHLGTIERKNDSKYFLENLLYFWEDKNYKSINSNGLFKTLLRANIFRIIILLIFSLIIAFLEFACVLIIKAYIDYFQNPDERKYDLKTLGIAFILSRALSTFLFRQLSMLEVFLSYKSSLELACLIYNKVLKASPSSYGNRSNQGEIVNFIQIDAPKLSYAISLSPKLLIAPLLIIIYIYLLFKFFGVSFIFGMILFFAFLFTSYLAHSRFSILQKVILEKKDNRMKITTETFDSIKLLKLYNWENEFKDRIFDAMIQENAIGVKLLNITMFNICMYWSAPIFSSIVTIGVYQYMNSSILIGNILIGLTIFSMLQPIIAELPITINSILETFVSIRRIEKFIRQDDINQNLLTEEKENEIYAIKIENANFSWGADPTDPAKPLNEEKFISQENNDINIDIKKVEDKLQKEDAQNSESTLKIKNSNNINDTAISELKKSLLSSDIKITKNEQKETLKKIILKNINLEIKKGEIIGIIGEVSSGKSTLLQAILNNLILLPNVKTEYDEKNDQTEILHNSIILNGTTAYASQIPWIQNDTIKNNIVLFGDYDEIKYQKVLNVCQLNHDIDLLEAGDNTEIGEKGINLSGGQKARVALARAVYSQSDIYLLDDPISALDSDVGKKIMNHCILNHLKGSTVLLVTHALQYLKNMDKIIYLSQGEIKWTGTYEELKNVEFFIDLATKLHKTKQEEEEELSDIKENKEIFINEEESSINNGDNNNNVKTIKKNLKKTDDIKRITLDEEQSTGEVKFNVYVQYFQYMGGSCFGVMIIIIMLLWQINKAGSDYWLSFWSKKENQGSDEKIVFFIIYASLGIASSIFIFFRIFLLTKGTIRLVIKLHTDMISKLIRAPINLFHDTTPRGQIYNRLSKDFFNVVTIMFYFGSFLVAFFSSIGCIVICVIFQPITLYFVPVFFICGYFLTKYYLKGSRDLTRLEGVSRSPLLNTLSETITGAMSIRAFKIQHEYLNKFYSQINNVFKVEICLNGASNWFGMNMDFISLLFITFITVIIIVYEKELSPQSVGLILTYGFALKERLFETFKLGADFENMMVSMERCLQYTKLEEEKEFETENDNQLIKENWPTEGKVEFVDYSVRYRPNTEIVLKNLNFKINPMEKIGIVGRTGSGKSTMCLCLFRILEPLTGTIKIDNVDVMGVGLNLLRQKITIIPQDPSLMKGTLKYNIDPFNKYKEEEIVNVLTLIGFSTILKQEGLDKIISEGGENLSVGEKQLICIARAILRKSKIVVMDEATANIDIKTEEVIQNAIHTFFKDTTIITIAHRIKTIINYDRILVLRDGELEEFDTPANLIQNKSSMFYELYSKSSL